VGITDTTLSGRLQLDPDLTLEKAKKVVQQSEVIRQQQGTLKEGAEKAKLDEAKFASGQRGRVVPPRRSGVSSGRGSDQYSGKKQCSPCGKEQHPIHMYPARSCVHAAAPHTHVSSKKLCSRCSTPYTIMCPVRDVTCHRCNRRGHYKMQCYAKTVLEVIPDEKGDHLDSAFLDTVTADHEKTWTTTTQLGGKDVAFKMDTGAEVTAISEETYQQLDRCELSKPVKVLYGPSHQPLPVVGIFSGSFTYKRKATMQPL
jgi:hypothetical protein